MFRPQGSKYWERQFHRYGLYLNDIKINLADEMMKERLIREIDTTIEEKLKENDYTDEEIRSTIKSWHKNKVEEITHHILVFGLYISFDMGWKKIHWEAI